MKVRTVARQSPRLSARRADCMPQRSASGGAACFSRLWAATGRVDRRDGDPQQKTEYYAPWDHVSQSVGCRLAMDIVERHQKEVEAASCCDKLASSWLAALL